VTAADSWVCRDAAPHGAHRWLLGEAMLGECAGVTAAEHTLVRDGWPHKLFADGPRPNRSRHDPIGRAACSCHWVSAVLEDTEARRQAHAQHVEEEAS
jgi:hypothetical protein